MKKTKTIGDCYMAAAGVPDPCSDHATRAALLAFDMRDASAMSAIAGRGGLQLMLDQLRAGHGRCDRHETLPLRPLGRRREHGEPDGVQRHARSDSDHSRDMQIRVIEFVCDRRDDPVKGKGEMETWYLVGER